MIVGTKVLRLFLRNVISQYKKMFFLYDYYFVLLSVFIIFADNILL